MSYTRLLCDLQHFLLHLGQGCKLPPVNHICLTNCLKRKFELLVEHRWCPLLTVEGGPMTVSIQWPTYMSILLHNWSAGSLSIGHVWTCWLLFCNNAEEPNKGGGCSCCGGWKLECAWKDLFLPEEQVSACRTHWVRDLPREATNFFLFYK